MIIKKNAFELMKEIKIFDASKNLFRKVKSIAKIQGTKIIKLLLALDVVVERKN